MIIDDYDEFIFSVFTVSDSYLCDERIRFLVVERYMDFII